MNNTSQSKTIKWHESYLRMEARNLRSRARKEARGSGFEPLFDKGFTVGINPNGHPFVQINFRLNGSIQYANCAI